MFFNSQKARVAWWCTRKQEERHSEICLVLLQWQSHLTFHCKFSPALNLKIALNSRSRSWTHNCLKSFLRHAVVIEKKKKKSAELHHHVSYWEQEWERVCHSKLWCAYILIVVSHFGLHISRKAEKKKRQLHEEDDGKAGLWEEEKCQGFIS